MIKIYSKKNSLIKRSVGIYSVHGLLDLKLRRYKNKEEYYNLNEYITNIKKFFLSNQINLYDIRNLKKTNFLETIIFIDTANPDLILRKYNIYCNKKILIMREPPIILPELWKKDVVIKYNHILTYNKDFIRKFKRLTNMTFSLMPKNLDFKKFNFLKKKKIICMFAGNKFSNKKNELYSERKKIIDHFINKKDNFFDLYSNGLIFEDDCLFENTLFDLHILCVPFISQPFFFVQTRKQSSIFLTQTMHFSLISLLSSALIYV